jgi:hypothetical protein
VTLVLNHAQNSGGGIFQDAAGNSIQLIGTLIAQNTITIFPGPPPVNAPQNCAFGAAAFLLTSSGYNLDDDGTCNLAGPGDLLAPIAFGPLMNNGGPTDTHALLPGVRAINAAPLCADVAGAAVVVDQRQVPRPQGFACDIGAYEFVSAGPPNDDCAAAPVLPGPGVYPFNNTGANTDGPPDACFSGLPGQDNDIWYTYYADCRGTTTIELFAAGFDQLITIYDGPCPQAGGVFLTCGVAPAGAQHSVTLVHVNGQQFTIRIGGVAGQQGPGVFGVTLTCECPADIARHPTGDNMVNIDDLLMVINGWGPCAAPCPPPGFGCHADIDNDCDVDIDELLIVINNWGPCP